MTSGTLTVKIRSSSFLIWCFCDLGVNWRDFSTDGKVDFMKMTEFGTKVVQAIDSKIGDIKAQREEYFEALHAEAEARYANAKSKYAKSILGMKSAALLWASVPISMFLIPGIVVFFGVLVATMIMLLSVVVALIAGVDIELVRSTTVEMIVGVTAGLMMWFSLRCVLRETLIITVRQISTVRKFLRWSDVLQLFGLTFSLIADLINSQVDLQSTTAWFWHGMSTVMLKTFNFGFGVALCLLVVNFAIFAAEKVPQTRLVASLRERGAPKTK